MARRSGRKNCTELECLYRNECSSFAVRDSKEWKTLSNCKVGDAPQVKFICPQDPELCRKLNSMGVVEGVNVEVVHSGPGGDPMAIAVRRSRLALRRSEASMVEIED